MSKVPGTQRQGLAYYQSGLPSPVPAPPDFVFFLEAWQPSKERVEEMRVILRHFYNSSGVKRSDVFEMASKSISLLERCYADVQGAVNASRKIAESAGTVNWGSSK